MLLRIIFQFQRIIILNVVSRRNTARIIMKQAENREKNSIENSDFPTTQLLDFINVYKPNNLVETLSIILLHIQLY